MARHRRSGSDAVLRTATPGHDGVGLSNSPSVQREARRVPADVRWRRERRAVDRTVVVLARECREANRRRKRIILEFSIARQDFRATVKPGALGHVKAGMGPPLV